MDTLERLRGAKIGFLFCGGASRCVFQIGVIETFLSLGIHPAMCLGVSGGTWNAAAVAVGNAHRLRPYWRFFWRMPNVDLTNLLREHSPFIWSRLHERAFQRYVSVERIRSAPIPVYVGLTRLRDRASIIMDLRTAAEPLKVMLASNYLPPFYTHAPVIDGERYGDGGFSDNLPYESLFEQGADFVVLISSKAECEGGLFRSVDDPDHKIPEEYRERMVVIRPRHPLDVGFVDRRWDRLARGADLGAVRAHEVLLGHFPADENCAHSRRPTWYLIRFRQLAHAARATS